VLDVDTWQEIVATVRANKLRTFLTGFSVAWGIFMLIVLLGSGTGLQHGVEWGFRDDAVNSIWISPGETSVPYRGLQPGRSVRLTNMDHVEISDRIEGVEHITSRFYIGGSRLVSRGAESGSFSIRCVHPGHQHLERTRIVEGRYLNPLDLSERRKVAVIGTRVREALFGRGPAIGGHIKINGIPFRVVGLFEDDGSEGEMEMIYLPISTAQRVFAGGERVHQIMFTTGDSDLEDTTRMAGAARDLLAFNHTFDPEDRRALFVRNNQESFERISGLIDGIRTFVWVVGIGTLLAGVVGVSNIMMIVVRERTKEIGVRKALGATPGSILGLVLLESVAITAVAGYVGLVLGVGTLELVASATSGAEMFRNPEVNLAVAGAATVLLVAAGLLAGFVPARRAAMVQPIEALRDE